MADDLLPIPQVINFKQSLETAVIQIRKQTTKFQKKIQSQLLKAFFMTDYWTNDLIIDDDYSFFDVHGFVIPGLYALLHVLQMEDQETTVVQPIIYKSWLTNLILKTQIVILQVESIRLTENKIKGELKRLVLMMNSVKPLIELVIPNVIDGVSMWDALRQVHHEIQILPRISQSSFGNDLEHSWTVFEDELGPVVPVYQRATFDTNLTAIGLLNTTADRLYNKKRSDEVLLNLIVKDTSPTLQKQAMACIRFNNALLMVVIQKIQTMVGQIALLNRQGRQASIMSLVSTLVGDFKNKTNHV